MNPELEAVVVRDRRAFSTKDKFFVFFSALAVLVIVSIAGYWYYLAYIVVPTDASLESFGLEELAIEGAVPTGSIFYTAVIKEAEMFVPYVFRRSLTDDTEGVYLPFGASSYAKSDDQYDTFITNLEGTEDPDGWQPVWQDVNTEEIGTLLHSNGYNESQLTVSPVGTYYAYSYQTVANSESTSLADRKIALHNFESGEHLVIEGAAEPVFVRDGTELFYMKEDGIYSYSIASSSHTLISDLYAGFTPTDGMTASPNGVTLIVTSPFLQMISVQEIDLETSNAHEIGRIVTPGVRYHNPVFSPDAAWYIVTALRDDEYIAATRSYNSVVAEIRPVNQQGIVSTLAFPDILPNTLELNAWLDSDIDITSDEEDLSLLR